MPPPAPPKEGSKIKITTLKQIQNVINVVNLRHLFEMY
jgi:hypothetical protein